MLSFKRDSYDLLIWIISWQNVSEKTGNTSRVNTVQSYARNVEFSMVYVTVVKPSLSRFYSYLEFSVVLVSSRRHNKSCLLTFMQKLKVLPFTSSVILSENSLKENQIEETKWSTWKFWPSVDVAFSKNNYSVWLLETCCTVWDNYLVIL